MTVLINIKETFFLFTGRFCSPLKFANRMMLVLLPLFQEEKKKEVNIRARLSCYVSSSGRSMEVSEAPI